MASRQINRVIEHLRKAVRGRDTAEISDGQLLECFVARREERGFELLLARHGPMVLRVCKRVLGSQQDAEDAFQATFLVLARKAGSIRPRDMVGNWLYGVACRTALRARSVLARRRSREKQMNPLPEPVALTQEPWPEVQRLLDEELSRLGDRYRVPIVLCDLEGMTQKEVARRLGVPEGTLSSRLSRGRALLAKRLARRGVTVPAAVLTGMLAHHGLSACVPPALASATLKAGCAFAAGQTAVAGLVSSSVVSLTEGVLKAMLLAKITQGAAVLLAVAGLSIGLWAQVPGPAGKAQAKARSFDDLSPAARLQMLRKLADPDKEFQAADRGDVTVSIRQRGSLASANTGDITCQVGSLIKSIVDDGSQVRKGDVLVSLEDFFWQSPLKEKLRADQVARAAVDAAEMALVTVKLQSDLRELDCEIALRKAELQLKHFAGKDPDEKELLNLEVRKARLSRELAKAEGKSRQISARADMETKVISAEATRAQLEDIKEQIRRCTIKAPKDGVVSYYIPKGTTDISLVLAPGERVQEGQKLLQMPDLDNMLVNIHVPEAVVASVRGEGKDKSQWQPALIRVDAYPKTALKGHVKFVEPRPAADRYLAGEKAYKTLVAIDKDSKAQVPRLLPGMSAEVTIEDVARKKGVVRVPLQAVLQVGQAHYCYVKAGKEILKREVAPGLRGDRFVEIRSGIARDEMVVGDLDGLLRRLSAIGSSLR